MFKVNKLIESKDEKLEISYINNEVYKPKEKFRDSFKSLYFDFTGKINNDEYNLTFALNCRNEVLLDFPLNEQIDLKKYMLGGETFFYVNDEYDIDPEMNIVIMRYLKNNFIIHIKLNANVGNRYGDYAAIIEFEFNLDDYLI